MTHSLRRRRRRKGRCPMYDRLCQRQADRLSERRQRRQASCFRTMIHRKKLCFLKMRMNYRLLYRFLYYPCFLQRSFPLNCFRFLPSVAELVFCDEQADADVRIDAQASIAAVNLILSFIVCPFFMRGVFFILPVNVNSCPIVVYHTIVSSSRIFT